MTLSKAEKIELVLIAGATAAAWFFMGRREWNPAVGTLAGWAAALLLGQGLIRDLVRLARPRQPGEVRRLACLCAESTVGTILLLVALGITLLGVTQSVPLDRTCLALSVGVVLFSGFFAKDYVVRISKEKDHASVIVW